MDICDDIDRETYIPWTDHNTQFVRRRQGNIRRRNRAVQNANLLEDDISISKEEEYSIRSNGLNIEEISTSIKTVNGRLSYSNTDIEDYWKKKQSKSKTSCNTIRETEAGTCSTSLDQMPINPSSGDNNSIINIDESKSHDSDQENKLAQVTDQEVLRRCKLEKNAAIKGLITQRLISTKCLHMPDKENIDSTHHFINRPDILTSSKDLTEASTSLTGAIPQMVPLPEDPEILTLPLLAEGTIDESKHPHLDFTVDRLGKKTILTPQQYYLHEIDDSMFTFVKKT